MQPNNILDLLNKKAKLAQPVADALQRWRDVYYGISLHTTGACPRFRDAQTGKVVQPSGYFGSEYQHLFDNYLLSRHPRENEAIRNWRFSQYRPLTKAPFAQITEIVTGAIFQDANYGIELQDKEDEAYIWGNNFSGYDIAGYFGGIGYKDMVEDPNGVFVRMPKQAWYEQNEGKLQVDIYFVNSKDMVLLTADDLVFHKDGSVWWIDKQTIWRFSYNAQSKQYYLAQQDAQGYYAHMLGRLPITIAGGEWNTQGYYDSYYSKAKAAADDFVSSYSAAQLVDKEASHPFIVEASTDCNDCNGRGQVQQDCETCPSGLELVNCGSCSGSGQISRNPGQHIIIPHDKLKDGSPLQIINPDVNINTHHRDVCGRIMDLITEALHLQKTDAAQSGVAKAIDQERLYKFISKIANHIFDKLIHDTLNDLIAYRNVRNEAGVIYPLQYKFRISKPSQFHIKTSTDLLNEYNEGTKANMPVFVRQRMMLDFIDKQYNGDALLKKKAEVLMQLDHYCTYTGDEMARMIGVGAVDKEALISNRHVPQIIDMLIAERGVQWFLMTNVIEIERVLSGL